MSNPFQRLAESAIARLLKESVRRILRARRDNSKPKPTPHPNPDTEIVPPPSDRSVMGDKTHPWRMCPVGKHWVRRHPLTVPETEWAEEHMTIRRGHCRTNRGKKEVLTADELQEIAAQYFKELIGTDKMPAADNLGFGEKGNQYDLLIAGWTKFWNDVFQPNPPLDPDLIKALIATESGFNSKSPDTPSKVGPAKGLMQITEQARKILGDLNGELKDYLIEAGADEIRQPEVNIGAGLRWLFQKRKLASNRLGREATWEEGMAEYKGIFKRSRQRRDVRRNHERTEQSVQKTQRLSPKKLSAIVLASLAITSTLSCTTPSAVKIHNSTEYFLDIEAPKSDIWLGCAHTDKKRDFTWMLFYLRENDTTYKFVYHHPMDVSDCLEIEKGFRQMTDGAKTVRIVGHHPRTENKSKYPLYERIPGKFATPKEVHLTFIRLQIDNQCKAIYSDACDLPKNYWGGVTPGPSPAK